MWLIFQFKSVTSLTAQVSSQPNGPDRQMALEILQDIIQYVFYQAAYKKVQ